MKHFFLISLGVIFLAFFACRDKDPIYQTSEVNGSTAIIPWQECAYFTDHDYTVCFIGAKEERCPCNTNCLWEGSVDATLRVSSASNGIDTTIVLTTNSDPFNLHNFHTVGGKTIVFVNTDGIECADFGKYEKYKVIVKIQ